MLTIAVQFLDAMHSMFFIKGGLTLPRLYLQSLKGPPTQPRQRKNGTMNLRCGSPYGSLREYRVSGGGWGGCWLVDWLGGWVDWAAGRAGWDS